MDTTTNEARSLLVPRPAEGPSRPVSAGRPRRGAVALLPGLVLALLGAVLLLGRSASRPSAPALAAASAEALAQDVERAGTWDRILPGLELAFPRDHGAHPRTQTEWWYLTGQVEAADGRRFGLQVTVFRRGLGSGPIDPDAPTPLGAAPSPLRTGQVLLGHLAVTDVAAGRTRFAERLRRTGTPLARASQDDLDVVLEDWSLARVEDEAGERLVIAAADRAAGFGLELELAPAKPLVLHGERGYSSKGSDPGNASAYTSWTRLTTTGRLTLDGTELAIEGASWFDHEFGSSVLEDGVVGWDWFGLHLDDGRELMAFDLRREDGGRGSASAGTLVDLDGTTKRLGQDAFRIVPQGTWTSPETGATYPAGWRLSLPTEGLELVAIPLVADCELVTEGSTGVAYWEGPVELRAADEAGAATGPALGRGYAELTGYAGTMRGRL